MTPVFLICEGACNHGRMTRVALYVVVAIAGLLSGCAVGACLSHGAP